MGAGDIPGSGLVHEEEERKQQIFLASSHSFPWSPHFYRFTIEDPFMNHRGVSRAANLMVQKGRASRERNGLTAGTMAQHGMGTQPAAG